MTSDVAGRVILLVGASCAGKSTLARAIQASAPEHFLLQSLDGLFASVAERWGSVGERRYEGFCYQVESDTRRVVYGPAGWRLLRGFHRSVAAFARCGCNVVVDDMLLDDACLPDWAEALDGLPVTLVRLAAPLDELRRRERSRAHGRVHGLAEGHVLVHEGFAVDLSLDTSAHSPAEMAAVVIDHPPGGALARQHARERLT